MLFDVLFLRRHPAPPVPMETTVPHWEGGILREYVMMMMMMMMMMIVMTKCHD